ncbi:hypothetical protein [Microcoleus sp. N9_A4]|uniref:hypothetical protein n=1 Tax=Microcoleus sp. N9_A4 TaxID=3055383 RepID=UPI002FCFDD39
MPGICSSPHAYPISLDNQDVEFRGIGDRRFARLSSHHQAEYRYGGGIPACLVNLIFLKAGTGYNFLLKYKN